MFDSIRNDKDELSFDGNISIDDLTILDNLEDPNNIQRLRGIINNEISMLM